MEDATPRTTEERTASAPEREADLPTILPFADAEEERLWDEIATLRAARR